MSSASTGGLSQKVYQALNVLCAAAEHGLLPWRQLQGCLWLSEQGSHHTRPSSARLERVDPELTELRYTSASAVVLLDRGPMRSRGPCQRVGPSFVADPNPAIHLPRAVMANRPSATTACPSCQ